MTRIWLERLLKGAARAFPTPDLQNHELCSKLFQHSVGVIRSMRKKELYITDNPARVFRFCNRIGLFATRNGLNAEADLAFDYLFEMHEDYQGIQFLELAMSLAGLAERKLYEGDLDQAETLFRAAIDKIGPATNYPPLAGAMVGLGKVLNAKANYAEAYEVLMKAIEIYQHPLNRGDPDILIALTTLGHAYYGNGQYDVAEEGFESIVYARKETVGMEHADYAISLVDLAIAKEAQRKLVDADRAYETSISILRTTLGPNHPQLASALAAAGVLKIKIGQLDRAGILLSEALRLLGKLVGDEHPDFVSVLNSLAGLAKNEQDFEIAESRYLQVLATQKKVLGTKHPDYAVCLNNLARLYEAMGRVNDATELYEVALDIVHGTLGEDHAISRMIQENASALVPLKPNDAEAPDADAD